MSINSNNFNVSNFCACTGGQPEYVIKLNQQGPPGPQGEQGEQGPQGVSPEISIGHNEADNYTLIITTATKSFETVNLMADANQLVANLVNDLQFEKEPYSLNELNIDNTGSIITIKPASLAKTDLVVGANNINTSLKGGDINIGESNETYDIILKSGQAVVDLSNNGFTYNNEQIATQPWVEEQLQDYITDIPVASDTTLGLVKARPYYGINTSTMPEVIIGSNSGDTSTYQKLYVDDLLLPGGVVIKDTSISGMTERLIGKAYLSAEIDDDNNISIEGYTLESLQQEYDPLTGTWTTTGNYITTTPFTATTTKAGFVKPDGTTITITEDGTISAVSGGSGGTTDYSQLTNKPQINSVELTGNKTLAELGIPSINDSTSSTTTTYSSDKINTLNGEQNNQITALQGTVTTLQELVTSLQQRVTALETLINGGNA